MKRSINRLSQANVVAKSGTIYAKISYLQIIKTLGNNDVSANTFNTNDLNFKRFNFKNFYIVQKFGKEYKGRLVEVHNHKNKERFYVRFVSLYKIKKHKLWNQLINEKICNKLMADSKMVNKILHIGNIYNNIYQLFASHNFSTLSNLLNHLNFLSFGESKLMIAGIILILESAHRKGIVIRDISPDNIIIPYDGYPILRRLATSKKLFRTDNFRTKTIIGTPQYMSPEMVHGNEYTFSTDYWSLGILYFELLTGYVPFGESVKDPYEIFQLIIGSPLNFPPVFSTNKHYETAKNVIKKLLDKDEDKRLPNGVVFLKDHELMSDLDWTALQTKQISLNTISKYLKEVNTENEFKIKKHLKITENTLLNMHNLDKNKVQALLNTSQQDDPLHKIGEKCMEELLKNE